MMWRINHGSIASLATVTNPKGLEIIVIYFGAGDICAVDDSCDKAERIYNEIPDEVRGALEIRFRRIFDAAATDREDIIKSMGPVLIGLPQKGE